MKIGVITLFPESFESLNYGLIGKALSSSKAELFLEDLRDHGEGRHKVVDDEPYGGGDGMILKADPIEKALNNLSKKIGQPIENMRKIFMSPAGVLWNQSLAEEFIGQDTLAAEKSLVLLCGRYGGVDERILEKHFKESISVGPYILNGGETAALCVIETLIRILPGVLGNSDSKVYDSFSEGSGVESPSYTRPKEWSGMEVPEVLLSGDHRKITKYRDEISKKKTKAWSEKAIKIFEAIKNNSSLSE